MSTNTQEIDLVGGPFAVVESDPGVFTALLRALGIKGVEATEVYDIQPWTLEKLAPFGLILCSTWRPEHDQPRKHIQEPDRQTQDSIWFANQLVDNACSSLAILNILFNCSGVDLGEDLTAFKTETVDMSPKMKGLAISNSSLLRNSQNSLARPADVRGALHADAALWKNTAPKKPMRKRARLTERRRDNKDSDNEAGAEAYHFIGYVPVAGKVWELDGLRDAGPLEVGELDTDGQTKSWEHVVRPALKMRMDKYAAAGYIQFSLLALVPDNYEKKSDTLELLKRERLALERRLEEIYGAQWKSKVDQDLLDTADDAFSTLAHPSPTPSTLFASDIGARKLARDLAILDMPQDDLVAAWETCIGRALEAKIGVDEEAQKALSARADSVSRTFDYEPFIREYITALHDEGLLSNCISGEDFS